MASRDEVFGLARETRDAVLQGDVAEDRLTPKGRLLLRLGQGDLDVGGLTPQDEALLGLDPTFGQRVGRAFSSTASEVGQAAANLRNLPGLVTEGLPAAWQAAVERMAPPTLGQELLREATTTEPLPGREPSLPARLLYGGFSPLPGIMHGAEQAMRLPGAFGAAVAELGPEQAKPLTEAIAANAPFLGARPLVEGATAAIPGAGRRVAQRLASRAVTPLPTVEGYTGPVSTEPLQGVPPPLPLPGSGRLALPGGGQGIIIPRSMVRPPTERVLGPGVEPKALPPAPRSAEIRPFQEPPVAVPGRGIPAETERLVPRPVPEPPRPAPSQFEVAATRAGIDLTAPSERPTGLLDPFGRQIRVPRRGAAPSAPQPAPGTPQRPPEAPPGPPAAPAVPKPPVQGPAEPLRPQTLADLPKPPTQTPPNTLIEPPPAARPRRPTPFQEATKGVDVGTVKLDDPDEVLALVRGRRGINFGETLKGEAQAVPFFFKNRRGVAFDELVQEVADAQHMPPKQVESRLLKTMERFGTRRAQKSAAGRAIGQGEPPPAPKMPVELEARAAEPPADVAGWFQEGEWQAMSEADRLITIRTARSTEGVKGAEPGGFEPTLETAPKPVPEPPVAPKFERTALGDQGLIPGAESRQIPQAPLRATAAQKDVTETPLFGQERAAREAAQARAQGDIFAGPTPEQVVEQAGGLVRGRSTVQGQEMLWFSERGSDSTTVMPVAEVTPKAVAQRLGEIKARFEQPPGPPPAGPQPLASGPALEWVPGRPGPGVLERFASKDGRFVAEQVSPDQWRLVDRGAGRLHGYVGETFHEARQIAEQLSRGVGEPPPAPRNLPPISGGSGEVLPPQRPGEPPKVLPQFARESVRPPEAPPQVTPEQVRAGIDRVVAQARAPESPIGEAFGAGLPPGGRIPPTAELEAGAPLPADVPGTPMPEVSRAARFFARAEMESQLARIEPPEFVVRHDPVASRIVRRTYRHYDDGLLLRRELEERARAIYRGLRDEEVVQVNTVLDTPDVGAEAYSTLLPPRLAEVARRARAEIFDAGADGTGLARERRITGYFPRFRDTVRMEATRLVLDPQGQPYLPRTYLENVPRTIEAFFFKPRTASDPASHLGLDGVLVYQRAVARHLTLNGGFHPATGQPIAGYLNELQGLVQRPMLESLKPYLSEFVNYFLGVPGSRPGTPLQQQASRIARNVQFSRLIGLNISSPIANLTQQVNTLAQVRPQSWVRAYADLLDPARRGLARQYLGLEELAKADLEMVQNVVTRLDRIEDLTAKIAHVSGVMFRASEGPANRYHAFLAGLRDAEVYGLQGRQAIEYARDIVELTQFPGSGPAKIAAFRGPFGATFGQFKQFQIRQSLYVKRLVEQDIAEWTARLRGQRVPIQVGGADLLDAAGQPVTRAPVIFPRTAKFLIGMTAVGGPDAIFPGFDDYLRERGVAIPGLFPAIGVGISQVMGFGAVTPGDVTRSLLFFLPGPLIGHIQDMLSASTGVNWGHGLTEMLRGDLGTELTLDQRVDRALRGFVPVGGIAAARGRQALKMALTPGEERAARTLLEALALEPATGRLLRRTEPAEPGRVFIGMPPQVRERVSRERETFVQLDERAKRAVQIAADHLAAGDAARAQAALRDAERRLGLRPGQLAVSHQALQAARDRRRFTPLERQRFQLRRRFPLETRESQERVPGLVPPEPPVRGLGLPRLRLR